MNEIGNVQKYFKTEYRVLRDLASSDSPLGFNELQEKTSVSSRTLAKHLKKLVPKNVQKEGEKYRITDSGRHFKTDIGRELKHLKKVSRQSHVGKVEVCSIGPKHFCKGTMEVTSTRELLPKEREKLDKAITYAIRTFRSIVPEDSQNWRISIYSHNNSKK